MSKQSYREVLGQRLREFREERNISKYTVAKKGNIRIGQVGVVEDGNTNYTMDVFLGYITGCDLYIYFSEKTKEGDLLELIEKCKESDPKC